MPFLRPFVIAGLGLVRVAVFHDRGHGAFQYEAQFVYRFCGDGLSVLHAVDGVGRQPMLVNQVIGGHILIVQRIPERSVGNHTANPLIQICYIVPCSTC